MRWLDGINNLMYMSLSKLWELVMGRKPGVLQSMGLQRVGHDLTDLTELYYSPNKAWLYPALHSLFISVLF